MDKKSDQNNSASFEDAQDENDQFDDCDDTEQKGKSIKSFNYVQNLLMTRQDLLQRISSQMKTRIRCTQWKFLTMLT